MWSWFNSVRERSIFMAAVIAIGSGAVDTTSNVNGYCSANTLSSEPPQCQ